MLRLIPASLGSLLAIVLTIVPARAIAAQAPVIEKVDPPNWWAGYSINPVRLLVRGQHLAGAHVACARVKCAILSWHAVIAALDGEDKPVTTE